MPNWEDWKRCFGGITRGTVIGFFLGILPGGGPVLASFGSYAIERRLSKHPEKFGTGVIEGVASPEAANNSGAQGCFVPLLTLGIPSNITTALLLGALMIHGITPGPLLMKNNPDLFWGFISSMYIGNIMLLILNLPLIPLWVKLLRVPYRILFPFVLLFCIVGVYSINNNVFDIYMSLLFGVLGYVFRKLDFETAPLILAVVLGPMMEKALRQSLQLSGGEFSILIDRPICLVLFGMTIFFLLLPLISKCLKQFK
jgi:putative tricarboxylic transport membrane protein